MFVSAVVTMDVPALCITSGLQVDRGRYDTVHPLTQRLAISWMKFHLEQTLGVLCYIISTVLYFLGESPLLYITYILVKCCEMNNGP